MIFTTDWTDWTDWTDQTDNSATADITVRDAMQPLSGK